MPTFDYRAKDEAGKNITGSLVVGSLEDLEQVLVERRLFLVSAKEKAVISNVFESLYSNSQETLLFTVQMSTALQSGLPLTMILEDMIEEATNKHFKHVLGDVKMNVEAGNTFSDSLGLYPSYFDEIYRVIVSTGERSGKLDLVFADLVKLLEWDKELKKQVRKAMRFPLTMGCMLLGLIIVVLKVVIPSFADLFNSTGTELPGPTLFLLAAAEFLDSYWAPTLLGIAIFFLSFKLYYKTDNGRYQLDSFKLKMPFFGTLSQKIAMSRFAHFWKILFESGIDLSYALNVVSEVVQNRRIEAAILTARQDIMNGRSMADSFQEARIFPNLVLRMINLGETTGALETSLQKISEYYDREIPEAIDSVLAATQPIIMVLMAGILIIVALAIVLPMFGMMEAIH